MLPMNRVAVIAPSGVWLLCAGAGRGRGRPRHGMVCFLSVLLIWLGRSGSAAADQSAVVPVVLRGKPDLVAAVGRLLAERGVPRLPTRSSVTLLVELHADGDAIQLHIEDADGRTADRIVANAEIAVALIDSWCHPEMGWPLLGPSTPPAPLLPAAKEGGMTAVRLSADLAIATDGSLWVGTGFGVCVRVAWLCIGLGGRIAGDDRGPGAVYGGKSATLTRVGAELLATVEIPLHVGRELLSPGIGLGAGWLSETATHEENDAHLDSFGPRIELRLMLAWPAWWRLAINAGVWAELGPGARSSSVARDGFTIPPEPLGYLGAGLGVQYEGL